MQKNKSRKAGILMPVSALPSNEGIGTLGSGAYAFIDWLKNANMKVWQVLPLLPTGYGDSPYQSLSSDALNYYFIDLESLEKEGLLQKVEYAGIVWSNDKRRIDYGKLFIDKIKLLRLAHSRFNRKDKSYQQFLKEAKYNDFALFSSLKIRFQHRSFTEWEIELKNGEEEAVERHKKEYQEEIDFWQFTQYVFLRQWKKLKTYANERGIEIMGDMPIYVAFDSVENWKYKKDLFMLDADGNASWRAGVPPDGFCDDGQLWGNPVYDWDKLKQNGYLWWKQRIEYAFTLFDSVRIDHFRGFDRFYVIPGFAQTAKEGTWLDGPKASLFQQMKEYNIIAEDLGVIDDGVRTLLKETGYPGMKVFQFAFDGNPYNEYLPIYYDENCVAYTGTHDNQTLRGFIEGMTENERTSFEKEFENQCLKMDTPYIYESIEDECQSAIRLLMASKANTVILPMQDVLCMGEEARINAPSTLSNKNWTFRFLLEDLKNRKAVWLDSLTKEYNR